MIAGILEISKVTYGSIKDKFYYKCFIENNKQYILVPYKLDLKQFSKKFYNKFVLIEKDLEKQGYGNIIETIGPVNDIKSFYRYQLFKYNLNHITGFNKITIPVLNKSLKINRNIYTIDPKGSKDLDDAFSISYDDNSNSILLSIYITNVLKYGSTNYLNYIKNVSTIYCNENNDDMVHNMIPKKLAQEVFSFIEGSGSKSALTLDLTIELINNELSVVSNKLYNSEINISKNFTYEDSNKITNDLIKLTNHLNKKYKFLRNKNISDTHEAIEYIMIYMNIYCANLLKENNVGIFRYSDSSCEKTITVDTKIDIDLLTFLNYENKSIYSLRPNIHNMFDDYYVHITSPIRRLVDILNMIQINKIIDRLEEREQEQYYNLMTNDMSLLNKNYSIIKKIQNQVKLLNILKNESQNNESQNNESKIYKGFIIDNDDNDNNDDKTNYQIWLPLIKTMYNYKTKEILQKFNYYYFKIYVFDNESNYKRKIKLMKV